MKSLKLVAVLLMAALVIAIGGVALADGFHIHFGGSSATAIGPAGMGGINGQSEYRIGTNAQFVWWNDTGCDVILTSYWVTGPVPSSHTVSGPMSITPPPTIPNGSSYSPINVLLNVPLYNVGKQYTVHVAGWKRCPSSPTLHYEDSFTFKVVNSNPNPNPNPNPGGTFLPFWLLLLSLSQHQNSGQPTQPSTPTVVEGTGSIEATVALNGEPTDGVVIAYKEGTSLMDVLNGQAKDAYTAKTSDDMTTLTPDDMAKLEVPAGKWNVVALKACGEGNEYWISDVKIITVFKYFTYEIELPLTGKIRPQ